jgi:hypothetical protein
MRDARPGSLGCATPMTRKSLRPHMNQIRTWVRQGRTDAWIAHQLEVTVQQIQAFKREQDLEGGEEVPEEVDLRAEDDAAIAAALDEEERRRAEEEQRKDEEERRRAEEEQREAEEAARRAEEAPAEAAEADAEDGATDEDAGPVRRGRGRSRSGRGRGRRRGDAARSTFEATFDHGEEGYGLWLDPEVADDATYAEHWAGHRPVEVTLEEDQIVIRRAGGEDSG